MQRFLTKINQWRSATREIWVNNWYGSQNTMYKTNSKEIEDLLNKSFPEAEMILVEDKSGGCGAMFEIYVESKQFKNMSIIKQHKMVYEVLKDQIKIIHGLRVVTKAL